MQSGTRRRRGLWLCFAAASLAFSPAAARAQGKSPAPASSAAKAAGGRSTKKPQVTVDVAALTAKLKSSDPTVVEAALIEAKAAGQAALPVAPAVEDLLRRGTQAQLVELALQALAEVGREASSSAIVPYARHRNPETRKQALRALSRTGGPLAVTTLRDALSDPDPAVRGAAARGLGPLPAQSAVKDLFAALDHGVTDASASIGQLCAPEECDKLAGKLPTFGFDTMAGAFEAILTRPEVPDDTKVRVVERVRDLRTPEAAKFLRDMQARFPAGGSPRVRQAIEQAVLAAGGKS
jgi:HEAT repeat protein